MKFKQTRWYLAVSPKSKRCTHRYEPVCALKHEEHISIGQKLGKHHFSSNRSALRPPYTNVFLDFRPKLLHLQPLKHIQILKIMRFGHKKTTFFEKSASRVSLHVREATFSPFFTFFQHFKDPRKTRDTQTGQNEWGSWHHPKSDDRSQWGMAYSSFIKTSPNEITGGVWLFEGLEREGPGRPKIIRAISISVAFLKNTFFSLFSQVSFFMRKVKNTRWAWVPTPSRTAPRPLKKPVVLVFSSKLQLRQKNWNLRSFAKMSNSSRAEAMVLKLTQGKSTGRKHVFIF